MSRRIALPLLLIPGLLIWAASAVNVRAQTETPPSLPSGQVSGSIFNVNQGLTIAGAAQVMLHIWDQNFTEINMLHAQSAPDGTYIFTEVDLQPQYRYGVMTIYEGVTYFSDIVSGEVVAGQLELDLPVYETTSDPSAVLVNQMHVLFNFAQDGLEITEVYSLSNLGERTVKDTLALDDGQPATLRFPLPTDADFIFFQPDQQDRFVKFSGGFADTYPLLPGEGGEQIVVQYLVPFGKGRTYTFTAPVNVQTMNLLLPADAGVSLQGSGLSGPQPYTSENGSSYAVYSYTDLQAGDTTEVGFVGAPRTEAASVGTKQTIALAIGGGVLGLALIGVGIWWWRRPEEVEEDNQEDVSEGPQLDEVLAEIVRLDEANEQGSISLEEHQQRRQELLRRAKRLMEHEG